MDNFNKIEVPILLGSNVTTPFLSEGAKYLFQRKSLTMQLINQQYHERKQCKTLLEGRPNREIYYGSWIPSSEEAMTCTRSI